MTHSFCVERKLRFIRELISSADLVVQFKVYAFRDCKRIRNPAKSGGRERNPQYNVEWGIFSKFDWNSVFFQHTLYSEPQRFRRMLNVQWPAGSNL